LKFKHIYILSTTLLNLSIPDAHFPESFQPPSGAGFSQALHPLADPNSILLFFVEFYGIRHQSGSLFLFNVGSGFQCLRSFDVLACLCSLIWIDKLLYFSSLELLSNTLPSTLLFLNRLLGMAF